VTADQLSSGRDERPRRLRSLLGLGVLSVVVLLVLGARWESQRQLDALLAAAGDTEKVVQDSRRSLGGMVQYSNGLLARTDLTPSQRGAVLDSMAVDADRYPPRVAAPRTAVEQVRPLPWDDDLRRAREAYLVRIDAWTAFVAAAQQEPDTLLWERRATRPAREAAVKALEAAAGGRSPERLDQVRTAMLRR
jgi:hypothetical protein